MRMPRLGLLLAQWAPYLVLDIIFRGPFSHIGGKVGVKLDPGAEGRLWARGRGMLASVWPAPAAAAAPGTACKSGATYQESAQEYHCLLEVHRQSTLQPMHRDSHTDARQAGLSVFNTELFSSICLLNTILSFRKQSEKSSCCHSTHYIAFISDE